MGLRIICMSEWGADVMNMYGFSPEGRDLQKTVSDVRKSFGNGFSFEGYEKTLSNGKSALVTDVFELLDGDKVTIILDEDGNLGLGNSLGHSIIRNLE